MRRLITSLALFSLLGLSGCAAVRTGRTAQEDPVLRLQRDIAKVERAIEATKRLLVLAHSAAYVPDLYMRLAELYAEQSRYEYLIAYERDRQKKRAVVSIQARLLKEQAIQLYDRVAREFPDYQDLDKALFFKGHELRELGSYDDMISTFERLVRDHPRSQFRHQALLILGDYHFDRSNFPRAEDQYRKVLADSDGPQHAMARYKMAWSRQNQDDCKAALGFFEASARTALQEARRGQGPGAGSAAEGHKLDLRREALVDSGFCFTEVRKLEDALPFYRSLSDNRSVYVAALARLARRYVSKGQVKAYAPLYREILEVDPQHEDALEFVQRLYEGLQKGPPQAAAATVDRDVEVILRVAELRYFNPRTPETIRKALVHDFEVYARDLATKAQLLAKDQGTDRPGLIDQVATAYERYLSFFRDVAKVKEAQGIEANLADTLFAAKRYIPAGHAYERVARSQGDAERKASLFSAAAAYAQALKLRLDNYEQVEARAGLYRAGREYIARYPQAENLPELKFNIANALYDEGNFREAITRFTSLVEQYPQSKEGSVAAQLTLDCYRLLYDMEGLARAGRRFLADSRIKDERLRKKLSDVVSAAQQRQLDVLTLGAGQGERGAETLLKFAAQNAGSTVGEKALLNAFLAAKDKDDLPQLLRIGNQILRDYPKSADIVSVLGTLGKLSAQTAQFDEAARYLDEAARREAQSPRGQELLGTAAVLRAQRGDRQGAEEALHLLQQTGAPAAQQADAVAALADLYRHSGDTAALIDLLKAQPQVPADLRIDVIHAQLLGGEPLSRFTAELQSLASGSGDAAAEARLLLADLLQKQLDTIAFTSKRTEDAKVIARRIALQQKVEAQYLAVVKLQRPRVVVAALSRLAQLYQSGAQFLSNPPVPPGLPEADTARYLQAFRAKAMPLSKKAEDTLRTCGETAQQLHVFSYHARACLQGQVPKDPEPFPAPVAPRPAQPDAPALRARLLKNATDGEALVQLALLHLKGNDLYGAKMVADRAVETGGPALSAAHNLTGVLSYLFGEQAEASRHFQEALKADKRNQRAKLNLLTLYREFGYTKLIAAELPGVGEIPADLQRDPAVLPAPTAGPAAAPVVDEQKPQEKK